MGNEVQASESSPEHPRSVSAWSWWSADDFLEVSFSVENVVSMMTSRPQNVRGMVCKAFLVSDISL